MLIWARHNLLNLEEINTLNGQIIFYLLNSYFTNIVIVVQKNKTRHQINYL